MVLVLLATAGLMAQTNNLTIRPKDNAPLSRFGMGDLVAPFYAASGAMGGLSSVYQNPYQLNIVNPAALTQLQATAFEVGLYSKYARLKDAQQADNVWSGNLQYLALGFPLRNPINRALDRQRDDWSAGMAFSLAPFSQVGYDLELETDDPELGTTSNLLKGTGGTYKVQWSNGFRYKGLSAGANLGYAFGKVTNSRLVDFDSIVTALNSEFLEEYSISGLTWNVGVQYIHEFMETNKAGEREPSGKRLIVGAYGTSGSSFDTERNSVFRRFSVVSSVPIVDTIQVAENQEGTGQLPDELTFGLAFEDQNRLYVGAEYGLARWSNYRNDAQPDQLADSDFLRIGFEIVPNADSYNSYWKRVRYRAGIRLETDPRQIDGEQARRRALTFGMGLPIVMPRQQVSFVNAAFEVGHFGVSDVLEETYVKFTLGFTLNDNTWFFKRKFN